MNHLWLRIIFALVLTSCSSLFHKSIASQDTTQKTKVTNPSHEEIVKAVQAPLKQVESGPEMELRLKNSAATAAKHDEPKKAVAHPAPASAGHSATTSESVPPEKSLGWLKNGNRRFVKGSLRSDGQSKTDRMRLNAGQKPHAIILSCSDSRVPPELVFDQKLGEVFVVRTAGENPDNTAIASIEYALEHLGSKLIVVMGHTSCGAVKAAFASKPNDDNGSAFLNRLVEQISPRLNKNKAASEQFVHEGWDNVMGITDELSKKSKIIREAIASGEVKIQPALYHMDTGAVAWSAAEEH